MIARRARTELHDGAVVNYGFGIPDQVAKIVTAEHAEGRPAAEVGSILGK